MTKSFIIIQTFHPNFSTFCRQLMRELELNNRGLGEHSLKEKNASEF